ncbi:hypothetical protein PO870_19320 [Rhizobium sp. MJ37]|nr:hypothetical protein [Rhizobium sp. MJ37]
MDGEGNFDLCITAAYRIDGVHDVAPILDQVGKGNERAAYGISHRYTMAQLSRAGKENPQCFESKVI